MLAVRGEENWIGWSIETKLSFEGHWFGIVKVGKATRRTEVGTEAEVEAQADAILAEMLENA